MVHPTRSVAAALLPTLLIGCGISGKDKDACRNKWEGEVPSEPHF